MNDFFKQGKEAQKRFKTADIYGNFEKYAESVLSDAYPIEKTDFIKGLLDNTKNEVMFMNARSLADKYSSEYIWEILISSFNKVVKGKTKVSWGYDFVYTLLRYGNIKLFNYQAKELVTMILTYNGEYNTALFDIMYDKPWFKELKPYLLDAVIDNIDKITPEHMKGVLYVVKNNFFYKRIMEKTKDPEMFSVVLSVYRQSDQSFIEDFMGGIDITYMLKDYEEKFINNEKAMMFISTLIALYYTSETGKLFVDILEKGPWTDTRKIMWLKKIDKIGSIEVNTKLFELTHDLKYTPKEAQDIFLF